MDVTVRRTEPDDYKALHRIFSGPRGKPLAANQSLVRPRPRFHP